MITGNILSKKILETLFFSLFISGIIFAHPAYAGTLTCTARTTSCSAGEIEIFEMQNTTNSHAGLPAASYTNLVCCTGITGLGNSCSGTFATVLKLSGTTNAHIRQGTLSDYPSATNACISVPSGGSVSVGYQAASCSGFDTTLGLMTGTTNSHVGNSAWASGTTKICATAVGAGTLSVDIVNAGGSSVSSPSITMGAATLSLIYQTTSGTFGASAERVRINNTTANAMWTVAIAAEDGPSALWSAGTPKYDFNDPAGSAGDGGDGDTNGGQMTVNPSGGTLGGTCSATDVLLGSQAAFNENTALNSITLLSTGLAANTNCYWDFTGVNISQTIPAAQAVNNYSLNMILTITAN